jgi:hypothetical protein
MFGNATKPRSSVFLAASLKKSVANWKARVGAKKNGDLPAANSCIDWVKLRLL